MLVKPTLVILAAGMGSRYGKKKQTDSIGPEGQYIMDYSIFDAQRSEFEKIVFIMQEADIESLKKRNEEKYGEYAKSFYYAPQRIDDLPTGYVTPLTRVKPWGTGHAILCARKFLNEPFVVINADDFYGVQAFYSMFVFLNEYVQNDLYAMMGFYLGKTLSDWGSVSRGLCHVNNNLLVSIDECHGIKKADDRIIFEEGKFNEEHFLAGQSDLSFQQQVSMNFWGFSPSIFDFLERGFKKFLDENLHEPKKEYLIPELIDTLIRRSKVQVEVLRSEEQWFGMTHSEDKEKVVENINRLYEEYYYPENLFRVLEEMRSL